MERNWNALKREEDGKEEEKKTSIIPKQDNIMYSRVVEEDLKEDDSRYLAPLLKGIASLAYIMNYARFF